MPVYHVEVFSQGKWLDRGMSSGKHALDAIRNANLADKRKLPRRAKMVSRSDYKPTEGLSSLMTIDPAFESKSYRQGNLVNPLHVFPIDNRVDKTAKQAHADWAAHVASQAQYRD